MRLVGYHVQGQMQYQTHDVVWERVCVALRGRIDNRISFIVWNNGVNRIKEAVQYNYEIS